MVNLNTFQGGESRIHKLDSLKALFLQCQTDDELRFLVRSFANTGLRIGLSTKSVEKSLNKYFESFIDQASASEELSFFERTIFGYRIKDLSIAP